MFPKNLSAYKFDCGAPKESSRVFSSPLLRSNRSLLTTPYISFHCTLLLTTLYSRRSSSSWPLCRRRFLWATLTPITSALGRSLNARDTILANLILRLLLYRIPNDIPTFLSAWGASVLYHILFTNFLTSVFDEPAFIASPVGTDHKPLVTLPLCRSLDPPPTDAPSDTGTEPSGTISSPTSKITSHKILPYPT